MLSLSRSSSSHLRRKALDTPSAEIQQPAFSRDMSVANNSSNASAMHSIPPMVKFWLYFVFYVPSVPCSLFLLYQFLGDPTLRRSLHNHIVILLLLTVFTCQTTIFPWMFYYYFHADSWARSYAFCTIWAFIDWSIYVLELLLFAWSSIERHILIFHSKWVATQRQRFWIHYFPLAVILVYWLVLYSYVYFVPSCANSLDTSVDVCIIACLYDNGIIRGLETFLNNILPNIVIVVFSLGLLVRVKWTKYRAHQAMRWRKHRKMTIQLVSISAMFLFVSVPWALTDFLHLCGLLPIETTIWDVFAQFISYYVVFFLPLIALSSLPDLGQRLKRMSPERWRKRSIAPEPGTARAVANHPELTHSL